LSVKRHIVLVGLPGAGKTTIGQLAAAALGAPFLDLDAAIERRAGKSISRLFAENGEAAFRELERLEMEAALEAPPSVIAPGGGWAAHPGNLEAAAVRALTVYLRVAPDVAAERVVPTTGGRHRRADSGELTADGEVLTADIRPLLAGPNIAERVGELYRERRVFYERCEVTVPADPADPGVVAREVANLARSLAGWY